MTATTRNKAADDLALSVISEADDSILSASAARWRELLNAERRLERERIKQAYSALPQGPYRLLAIWDILKDPA